MSSASAPSDELGTSGTTPDGFAELTTGSASGARVVAPDVSQRPGDTPSGAQQLDPSSDSVDVSGVVREAIERLTGPERPPELNAGKLLLRSELFWTDVAPAKRELIQRVLRDRALTEHDCTTTLGGAIEAYAEARLCRLSMFIRLTEGDNPGPITGKGKTKALYRAYLAALDREMKLAQMIGLDRQSKQIDPVDAVRAAVEEANKR